MNAMSALVRFVGRRRGCGGVLRGARSRVCVGEQPCCGGRERYLSGTGRMLETSGEQRLNGSSTPQERSAGWVKDRLSAPEAGGQPAEGVERRARMALFRAGMRGWLELDVILGSWAARNVGVLRGNESRLAEFEHLLNAEAPAVYGWMTVPESTPEEYNTPTMRSIQSFIYSKGLITERLCSPSDAGDAHGQPAN